MLGSKPVVSLDIGSDKVKAIQLKKKGSAIELERFGMADVYPNGDKATFSGDKRAALIQAARKAMDDANINAKHCVSAISGESIIVRYIQLPKMPEDELRNALRWEAEEYIPFHIDEVNLDSVILGESTEQGKLDVLLIAAKKDMVNEHTELIKSLGLTPTIVDVDSFAFLNCYEGNYQPDQNACVCLLNIGAEITNINIYIGGTSRFSRDITVAGDAITGSIMQKTGMTYQRAEESKITSGAPMPDDEEAPEEEESSLISSIRGTVERMTGAEAAEEGDASASKAVRNVLLNLVGEVRRSIQFFENQAGGATVQKIIMGGGTSRMNNLDRFLQMELEVPVETLDPLRNIKMGSGLDTNLLETYRQHMGVGIGLSLRKVM